MRQITISTLLDITNSNARRLDQGTILEVNQYRNWTTMIQCISLRTNVEILSNPKVEYIDVTNLNFGTNYTGKHNVWSFSFLVSMLSSEDTDMSFLEEDINQVPLIENLLETININKAKLIIDDLQFKNVTIHYD